MNLYLSIHVIFEFLRSIAVAKSFSNYYEKIQNLETITKDNVWTSDSILLEMVPQDHLLDPKQAIILDGKNAIDMDDFGNSISKKLSPDIYA